MPFSHLFLHLNIIYINYYIITKLYIVSYTYDSCEELAENISVLESNGKFKDNVGNIGDDEGEGVGQTEVEDLSSVRS